MPTNIGSGKIVITDDDEHVVFDTDEGLFLGTDFVQGTITTPQRVATNSGSGWSNANINVFHTLAMINANATVAVGGFKVTVSGGGVGVAGLGWFCAGGSYVHYWHGVGDGSRPFERWHSDDKAVYTFVASGGLLRLHERVGLRSRPNGSDTVPTRTTLLAVTFQYKIFCGAFA